jgi:hypothetical protein
MKAHWLLACSLLALVATGGCTKQAASGSGATANAPVARGPHGGAAIALGREEYYLELVRDAAAGTLTAHVFNDAMDTPVRIRANSFELIATIGDEKRPLLFNAVANEARGDTIGSTATFEARAPWLRTTPEFDALLTSLKINTTTFLRVTFRFAPGRGPQ